MSAKKKRHIQKHPEECPGPDYRPETNVERAAEQKWPHEKPCTPAKEPATSVKTPPEYRQPEEDC